MPSPTSAKRKPQTKGPKTYLHGTQSPFRLSGLKPDGTWVMIYSRSRPGSRSRKVFSDDQQLAHLRAGFSGLEKGFEAFLGCEFACITLNVDGNTWQHALYHWTATTGQWRTGPPAALPAIARKKTWQFGAAGSKYYLHVRTENGQWLPKIWGWNAPNEYSTQFFSDEEQVARLQGQFADGGHDGNRFEPAQVLQAHIALCQGGSVSNAVCHWMPNHGWRPGAKPFESPDKPANLPEMRGRLWLAGATCNAVTIRPDNWLRRQFQIFAGDFPTRFPQAVERFTDPDTGELNLLAVEAYFWAFEARNRVPNVPGVDKIRLYFEQCTDYLVVRPSDFRVYNPKGFAPVSVDFFNRLTVTTR